MVVKSSREMVGTKKGVESSTPLTIGDLEALLALAANQAGYSSEGKERAGEPATQDKNKNGSRFGHFGVMIYQIDCDFSRGIFLCKFTHE